VVELVIIEVEVDVVVVDAIVVTVGVKVVDVVTGGTTTLATPSIPLAVEFDSSITLNSERANTRPSTSSRRTPFPFLNRTTSAVEWGPPITTFQASRAHHLSSVGWLDLRSRSGLSL
jgi:hypothetical protein